MATRGHYKMMFLGNGGIISLMIKSTPKWPHRVHLPEVLLVEGHDVLVDFPERHRRATVGAYFSVDLSGIQLALCALAHDGQALDARG